MPVVTELARVGRDHVAVELDGRRWRVLPQETAQAAGLAIGVELDRARARTVGRELRRAHALGAAVGALRVRDHSRASLEHRLAARGVAPAQRTETIAVLARAGLVDDERLAHGRAAALAARGVGDLAIAADLERRGLPQELVEAAIAELEPERARAERLAAAHGRSPRTLRRLAAKGFGEEALEGLVADAGGEEVG